MNKNLFMYMFLTFSLLSCGGQNKEENQPGSHLGSVVIEESPEVAPGLKEQIDAAKMRTYRDGENRVEVSYPDFFVVGTAEPGTARFHYPDQQEHQISMVMFVEPNVEEWSISDAVKNLSDANNVCEEEGKDYYIISGRMAEEPNIRFCEKCYLMNGKWVDYSVYYLAADKEAVGRLIETVKQWNPKP
jgi:hypothetical protein